MPLYKFVHNWWHYWYRLQIKCDCKEKEWETEKEFPGVKNSCTIFIPLWQQRISGEALRGFLYMTLSGNADVDIYWTLRMESAFPSEILVPRCQARKWQYASVRERYWGRRSVSISSNICGSGVCEHNCRVFYSPTTRNTFVCITPLSQFLKHCNLIPPCCHMAPKLIIAFGCKFCLCVDQSSGVKFGDRKT
jgi:hypothetical protein